MYQRILVPLDGSPTSTRGLQEAIRVAQLTKGRLRLMHVIDELSFALGMSAYAGYGGDWLGLLREAGASVLEQAKSAVVASGVGVETLLEDHLAGPVHVMVTAEASRWPADLIVLGTHGRRGIGRTVLGSSAENILRYSTVPVLLVRDLPEAKAAAAASGESVRLHAPPGAVAMQ
ncbi:universal stress protein [Variovorax sp. dw_308]|uniref:universal stress protein n=1 Tax=Variovorax sp. dw_308 TaxID=2721546 RepID=UPI001C49476B|nr:universal stress protein [Variovorax sp. dw_308]